MKVEFLEKFDKDLSKIRDNDLLKAIVSAISDLEKSEWISDIKNLKKLKGFKQVYRIRIGDYRIGVFIENNIIELARVVHRKDIYNLFP